MFLGAQLLCGPAPPHTSAQEVSLSWVRASTLASAQLMEVGAIHILWEREEQESQWEIAQSSPQQGERTPPGPSLSCSFRGAWCHGVSEVLYSFEGQEQVWVSRCFQAFPWY